MHISEMGWRESVHKSPIAHRDQKRALDSLKLELEAVKSQPAWVLRTKFRYCIITVYVLFNC